jgi:hypothetical protein
MLRTITVTLRGWYPDGRGFSGAEFVAALHLDPSTLTIAGEGRPWQTAQVQLIALDAAAFREQPEPSEAFAARLSESLLEAGQRLAQIEEDAVAKIREAGVSLNVLVDMWIDLNQLDLSFPASFLSQLSRLDLPLALITND